MFFSHASYLSTYNTYYDSFVKPSLLPTYIHLFIHITCLLHIKLNIRHIEVYPYFLSHLDPEFEETWFTYTVMGSANLSANLQCKHKSKTISNSYLISLFFFLHTVNIHYQ